MCDITVVSFVLQRSLYSFVYVSGTISASDKTFFYKVFSSSLSLSTVGRNCSLHTWNNSSVESLQFIVRKSWYFTRKGSFEIASYPEYFMLLKALNCFPFCEIRLTLLLSSPFLAAVITRWLGMLPLHARYPDLWRSFFLTYIMHTPILPGWFLGRSCRL